MAQNVTEDRNLYIGGSDIPIIMGISPFKTRFDLLLEKAGYKEDTFQGNKYTEYGNIMEPQIRAYENTKRKKPFKEDKKIIDDVRCHVDGFDGENEILEIKTTSQMHDNVDEYKIYLVQLLFYMDNYQVKKGKLDVYDRPEDFDETFDEARLQQHSIKLSDYKDLLEEIWQAVEQFRIDLKKVKENPFITEEELQPKELITLSNEIAEFELKMADFKELEKQYKAVKDKLFEEMEKHGIKKWTTNNGVQITRVLTTPDTTTTKVVFNENKFKEDFPDMYHQYEEKQKITTKGRSGYVKITLPKK